MIRLIVHIMIDKVPVALLIYSSSLGAAFYFSVYFGFILLRCFIVREVLTLEQP